MAEGKNTVGYTESRNFRCLEDLQEGRALVPNNQLNLDYCGFERCESGYAFGPYTRENYVLHIITEGEGSLTGEGKTWRIHANQAFLLKPGIETVYQADRTDPWVYYWVGFHGSRSEKVTARMGFAPENPVIDLANAPVLAGYISSMLDSRELTYAGFLKRSGFLALLLADIIEYAAVPDLPGKEDEGNYVEMAMAEIHAGYSHPVTIAQIAGKIGINRSYLSTIFKKQTGMAPQEYLVECRLKKASVLLQETDLPIRAISSIVGYTDPLTFTKAFKKKYGTNPSAYRETSPTLLRVEEKGDYQGTYKL